MGKKLKTASTISDVSTGVPEYDYFANEIARKARILIRLQEEVDSTLDEINQCSGYGEIGRMVQLLKDVKSELGIVEEALSTAYNDLDI